MLLLAAFDLKASFIVGQLVDGGNALHSAEIVKLLATAVFKGFPLLSRVSEHSASFTVATFFLENRILACE